MNEKKGAHYETPIRKHRRDAAISQGIQSIISPHTAAGHNISGGFGRTK